MTTPTAMAPLAPRTAEVSRNTAETQITVKLNLDGTGQARLSTGIGFFRPHAGPDRQAWPD
jgi:imidazoleglycerol-phosphate dehydratase